MITVYLYGHLATAFGREFRMEVGSVAEAVAALEANFPGKFYNQLRDGAYQVIRGARETGETISEEFLTFCAPKKDIHLVPVVAGAAKGGGQVVLGLALIAVGYALSGFTGGSSLVLAKFGAAMLFGGLVQVFTQMPEDVKEKESHVFTGADNVEAQGSPVPVVYGEFQVGSVVLSRSITVENL